MADRPSQTDQIVAANAEHSASFDGAGMAAPPSRNIAIVTCMDARIDTYRSLGLSPGEAHVIRNAGGVVTDDVIRSLCLSQHKLGTTEIVLIHHTGCGVQGLDEDAFVAELRTATGEAPDWGFGSFADPADDVRAGIATLKASPFVPHTEQVRGFVHDIETGLLHEVTG